MLKQTKNNTTDVQFICIYFIFQSQEAVVASSQTQNITGAAETEGLLIDFSSDANLVVPTAIMSQQTATDLLAGLSANR